jgi:DHA1 family multidrug resistance protein-like MFS transporter
MNSFGINKNYFGLLGCLFVVTLGYGVLLPILPFFLEQIAENTVNAENISFHFGILTAIYPITLVVLAPFWGRISDRVGHKTLMLIGLIGFTLMQSMIAFSSTLTMLYTARIIGSVFSSFLVPVVSAALSNITTEKERTLAMAWAGTAISAGVIVGPGISGILVENDLHFWLKSTHISFQRFSVPFVFLAIVGLVAFIGVLFFIKNVKPKIKTVPTKNTLFPPGRWKLFKELLLLSLILSLGITAFETVITLSLKSSEGFSASFIGFSLLTCGLVMTVLQPIVAKWGKLLIANPYQQMALGLLIAGVSFPMFNFIHTKGLLLGAIGIFSLGTSFIVPNLLSLISLKEPNASGWAFGMQSSFSGIGQIAGPLIGIGLYAVNNDAPFYTTGVLFITTSIIIFKKYKRR